MSHHTELKLVVHTPVSSLTSSSCLFQSFLLPQASSSVLVLPSILRGSLSKGSLLTGPRFLLCNLQYETCKVVNYSYAHSPVEQAAPNINIVIAKVSMTIQNTYLNRHKPGLQAPQVWSHANLIQLLLFANHQEKGSSYRASYSHLVAHVEF